MNRYNYSNIKKQFRLLLEAITEGQQSIHFDWYKCCEALSSVTDLKGQRRSFMDLKVMLAQCVRIEPPLIPDNIYKAGKHKNLKEAKKAAKGRLPYFLWGVHIYDSANGKIICHDGHRSY